MTIIPTLSQVWWRRRDLCPVTISDVVYTSAGHDILAVDEYGKHERHPDVVWHELFAPSLAAARQPAVVLDPVEARQLQEHTAQLHDAQRREVLQVPEDF
jgi:hypothetical protein